MCSIACGRKKPLLRKSHLSAVAKQYSIGIAGAKIAIHSLEGSLMLFAGEAIYAVTGKDNLQIPLIGIDSGRAHTPSCGDAC